MKKYNVLIMDDTYNNHKYIGNFSKKDLKVLLPILVKNEDFELDFNNLGVDKKGNFFFTEHLNIIGYSQECWFMIF